MTSFHAIILGPWRAVLVLGVTQILAWGALFYPPVLTVPLIDLEGQLVGVLQALNKKDGVFTAYDEHLAEALAAQIGVALQRARLLEQALAGHELGGWIRKWRLEHSEFQTWVIRPLLRSIRATCPWYTGASPM